MPAAFLDTNVFLYAAMHRLPDADVHKRPIADRLIYESEYCLSTQILAEFYYNARKKGAIVLSHHEAMLWLDQIALQPCVTIDAGLIRAGADLADRYQISCWDGAVIAAAHEAGATTLYSEDLNDGQTYGSVKVVNPFKTSTH